MDVKPVIPIRMKTLQMKAITALVPVMVEWLMVCVCVCVLSQVLTSPSVYIYIYIVYTHTHIHARCVLSICYHGAEGEAQCLLGDSQHRPQAYSVLKHTHLHTHLHSHTHNRAQLLTQLERNDNTDSFFIHNVYVYLNLKKENNNSAYKRSPFLK